MTRRPSETTIPGEVGESPQGQVLAKAPPQVTRASEGLIWVSWLRIAAITGVVLIHTAAPTAASPTARSSTRGQLAIALDFSSRWAVPVFVMVSGALLLDPARYRGAGDFLRRRALRLVPAIVVWHLVYLAYRVSVTGEPITVATAIQYTLQGRMATALYFFWIVLGLAIVTPVLVPWIAAASRRAVVLAGVVAASLPILTLVTVPIRQADLVWVETPWTWWIPYLGFYLLGYALRDVVPDQMEVGAGRRVGCWQFCPAHMAVAPTGRPRAAARALRTRRVLLLTRSARDRGVGLSGCSSPGAPGRPASRVLSALACSSRSSPRGGGHSGGVRGSPAGAGGGAAVATRWWRWGCRLCRSAPGALWAGIGPRLRRVAVCLAHPGGSPRLLALVVGLYSIARVNEQGPQRSLAMTAGGSGRGWAARPW
jgi:Acyltransferase family